MRHAFCVSVVQSPGMLMPTSPRSPVREKRYFKEIALILLIKICLLVALRLLFFSSPMAKPDGAAVSSHLLGTSVLQASAVVSLPSSDKRSSHDQ